jgi:2-polyprenyl-3-methyl-5-hydroxy-6-metoxy-1,4-benzoquinol methylase
MKYTEERIIPHLMKLDVVTYMQHIQTYGWAVQYLGNRDVLDAGCGAGLGSYIFSCVAKSLTMIDKDISLLEQPECRWPFVVKPIIYQADLNEMWVVEMAEKYDAVVALEVIEHLKDDVKFIANAFKWLRTGGRLVFSVPLHAIGLYHLHNYTYETLKQLIEGAAWESVEYHSRNAMRSVCGVATK